MANATKTRWQLSGQGYEFCNCDFGCGCNFGGFPNSKDGSCRALVGFTVTKGRCGDVDLSGVKGAGIFVWPKAIHQGDGKAAFIVDPPTTDKQVEALSQIFTGQLGGMPWEILGTTYEVAGLVRSEVKVNEAGRHSSVEVPGVGQATGDTLKNPVTARARFASRAWAKGVARP